MDETRRDFSCNNGVVIRKRKVMPQSKEAGVDGINVQGRVQQLGTAANGGGESVTGSP